MRTDSNDPLNTIPEKLGTLPTETIEEAQEALEDTAEKLHTLQDTLKVRWHLAGMEGRDLRHEVLDSLDELGKKLRDYAYKLDKKLDEGEIQVRLGLMEAKERWDITQKEAQELLELFKRDSDKAKEYMGGLRLQAKLAKLETRDFLGAARDDVKKGFGDLQRQASLSLQQLNKSVGDFLKRLH